MIPQRFLRNFTLSPPKTDRGDLSVPLKPERSIWLILFVAVFLAVFCVPYFSLDLGGGSGIENLFDLVAVVFLLMWFGGWTMAVLVIFVIFLSVLFGQERLIVKPGILMIRYEVLGAGISLTYPGDEISNLRYRKPGKDSEKSLRKGHIAFDSLAGQASIGWDLTEAEAAKLIDQITARAVNMTSSEPMKPPEESVSEAAGRFTPEVSRGTSPAETSRVTATALVFANMVPVFGVLFMDWRVGDVMLVFWAESAVIGIFNVAKMAVIGGWSALFFGPFFFFHYGGFMAGHLLFIYGFMIAGPDDDASMGLVEVFADFYLLLPALVALFISHGISFYLNFLGKREYVGRSVKDQMSEPYRRIIVMHITIIVGGFFVAALGDPLPALVLMIVLKVGADLRAHHQEHAAKN